MIAGCGMHTFQPKSKLQDTPGKRVRGVQSEVEGSCDSGMLDMRAHAAMLIDGMVEL